MPRPAGECAGAPMQRWYNAPRRPSRSQETCMRSNTIKSGIERAPHRSLLRATGQIREESDFGKPFIAICNSYIDIIPGHVHLQEFGRVVKEAVRAAGG